MNVCQTHECSTNYEQNIAGLGGFHELKIPLRGHQVGLDEIVKWLSDETWQILDGF
jgi:hypothetical protein